MSNFSLAIKMKNVFVIFLLGLGIGHVTCKADSF